MFVREQRGIGHCLWLGGRDPAQGPVSAALIRGQGPGTSWQTREGAVAPSLVRPNLGRTREGAEAPSLVLTICLNKVIP